MTISTLNSPKSKHGLDDQLDSPHCVSFDHTQRGDDHGTDSPSDSTVDSEGVESDGSVDIIESQKANPVREFFAAHPTIKQAAIAGCIAAMGEFIGGFIRGKCPSPSAMSRQRAIATFFVFGSLNGVFFSWWYKQLEQLCKDHPTTELKGIGMRLLYDRLLSTPPFLFASLTVLHFLQNLKPGAALKHAKSIYVSVLLMNFKIWTVSQFVNFKYVPLEYRVYFGSAVALWWNIYMSMVNSKAAKGK